MLGSFVKMKLPDEVQVVQPGGGGYDHITSGNGGDDEGLVNKMSEKNNLFHCCLHCQKKKCHLGDEWVGIGLHVPRVLSANVVLARRVCTFFCENNAALEGTKKKNRNSSNSAVILPLPMMPTPFAPTAEPPKLSLVQAKSLKKSVRQLLSRAAKAKKGGITRSRNKSSVEPVQLGPLP